MTNDEFLPTRRSLLSRLRGWDDQESWQEFFGTYGRLIYRIAVKAGLTSAEAEDVVQETVIIVARKLPGFKYDPALGSFKGWLMLITRRRIEKQLKKRMPFAPDRAAPSRGDGTRLTSTVERVADPRRFDLEAAWDDEWQQNLWKAALARLKAQVRPKQFQMFDLYALKGWPVQDVARALSVSAALVYVTKHRLSAILKREVKRLEAQR
jgi:RNA polymerase sigma factor (sigma-70 family)